MATTSACCVSWRQRRDYDLVAEVTQPEWTDKAAEAGTRYRYLVQTFVPQSDNRVAESDLSEPLEVTPEPVAPARPPDCARWPGPIPSSWPGSRR